MRTIAVSRSRCGASCLAVAVLALSLSACEPRAAEKQKWMEEALARNPTLQVLANDTKSGVITVRVKATGEVQTIKADELAAAPLFQLQTPPAAAAIAAAPPTEAVNTPPAPPPAEPAVPEPAPPPVQAAPAPPEKAPSYVVERSEGKMRITGPGVSIVADQPPAASVKPAVQHRGFPIICEGKRSMHVDQRTIDVEGDAVMVSDGCELYITNSRLTGTGAGITVQDAILHIDNSIISGGTASIAAEGKSKLFTRSTTYKGLLRRSEESQIADLGGNEWR